MQAGEVLYLYDRSSNPRKKRPGLNQLCGGLSMETTTEIQEMKAISLLQMKNITDQEVVLEVGERGSAVFAPFLIADGDEADGVRTGGFGSTGK